MSTSKAIDRICVIAVVAALLISILFANGTAFGIRVQAKTMGYEDRLFDTSKVHTIDIIIDDWVAFLQTAQSEEYSVCSVVIDGEAFKNVGIRGKGNTSLSTVSSMDSDRYSFKIEFDQYDSTKTYYGLDKLSLNNLIQDNTMMKDYLVYQMMNGFGAAAPLSSFVYITVNGEDWGLYLAVEAVEESFLRRNFGADYGELYKPDSMDMGGGRGNGKDFDAADFMASSGEEAASGSGVPNMPGGGMWPGMGGGSAEMPSMPEDFNPSQMGGMGGDRMGSGETKLQYIDDNPDSYSTIFSSAKTDVSVADQTRLITALKDLSAGKESAVDVEAVIRYFVVHNFVVNGDSYTGSMVHNYYLYEEDGRLSMIPWDYNLAFGTFQGNNASGAVNDDIDAPLSVAGGDRPMIDWIFRSEEYTGLYHGYFREFLNTVDAQSLISRTKALIAPYVEKDPTKFCTCEEFEKGVEALAAFCELRSRSAALQLAGEEANVDASAIRLSDMGTMGGRGQEPGVPGEDGGQLPGQPGIGNNISGSEEAAGGDPQFSGFGGPGGMAFPGGMERPENMVPGQNSGGRESVPGAEQSGGTAARSGSRWGLLWGSAAVLAAGLWFAYKFKR